MIAIDATPLALPPRRGVARALLALLRAWEAQPPPENVVLFTPQELPPTVPRLSGWVLPKRPVSSARAFRNRLPELLKTWDAGVLYVPWSAFPRTDVPVVATVHELPFVRLGPIEGRVRAHRHRAWLTRATAECAAVVVPSEATREDLLQLVPTPHAKVHVVPNGFDPAPWVAAGASAEPVSRPRIVMVGTGAPGWGPKKKGLDVLLEAVALLDRPDLEGVIVGEAGSALPPGWSAVGPDLEEEALHHLVASATVLVHPARSEGFGYPPLEAMAAGTPVVVSNGGALCETVGDAALVALAGDASALADALARVLDDAELRATLLERGRARADGFAPRDTAVRLYQVLKEAQATA